MSSGPLRILLVNGSLWGGGAEQMIASLAHNLRDDGHEVTIAVVTAGGEVQQSLRDAGFEVVGGLGLDTRLGPLTAIHRLRTLASSRRVQVVHSHDLRSLVDVAVCRRLGAGFRHLHTFHFGNYPHLPARQLRLERIFARLADRLVAVGAVQRAALASALGLAPDRIAMLWNGVDDVAPAAEPAEPPTTGGAPLLGSVSTFIPQKGLPTLVAAASLVRDAGLDFRLMLVGDGPLRAEIEADVARRGLAGQIRFTGWLPDVRTRLLPSLDAFVQSSHWEAMSVVILEAMACGLPIVATTVGENARILAHDRTALLAPARDEPALAAQMERVIRDAPLRARLGKAAREDYLARFTAAAMAARYVDAYREMLGGPRRRAPR